jgi:hypothetical protein
MKGQDERYSDKELNGLRRAVTEAEATRDTEAAQMQRDLEALQRRHGVAVATAQGQLETALAHNARVDKRESYWLERFHQHCHDPAVRSEEELNKRLHADMVAFQA